MDNISSGLRAVQTASSLDVEVLKLPKGFIKFVEIFLCLLAFCSLAAYDARIKFEKKCAASNKVATRTFPFEYPFTFENKIQLPLCEGKGDKEQVHLAHDNVSSSPRFFVFTGVISFLYAIVILISYVCISPTLSAHNQLGYKIDVLVHLVLVLFWFAGSFALIKAKNDIEMWTSPQEIFKGLKECNEEQDPDLQCKVTSGASYGAIGFAIGMGFTNLFAWSCNIYFILKDTPWFDMISDRFGGGGPKSGPPSDRYASGPSNMQSGQGARDPGSAHNPQVM